MQDAMQGELMREETENRPDNTFAASKAARITCVRERERVYGVNKQTNEPCEQTITRSRGMLLSSSLRLVR